jgi:hypothetical protein
VLLSSVCRFAHFNEPWYLRWASELGLHPRTEIQPYHRKVWEYAAVLQMLDQHGVLRAGARGLGFAVGTEPLPSFFAARGIDVVATDLQSSRRASRVWSRSKEHSSKADDLFHPALVERDAFDRHVTFAYADMNRRWRYEPGSFDFVWSCCAFEHLGGLDQGMRFVERSAKLLKRGGVAVHTTEYNCSSNDRTVSRGPGVLYRQVDIEQLDRRLRLDGRSLTELDFRAGDHEYDRVYDVPPYSQSAERQHIKLLIDGYVCTSMVIAVVA